MAGEMKRWYFEVRDNGQGTTEEVREELNEK